MAGMVNVMAERNSGKETLMVNEVTSQEKNLPMSLSEVKSQVNLIQAIMRSVMQKDVHYGVIPGCGDKPALLKAGAEKLCLTFKLVSEFEETVLDLGDNHREYSFKCRLKIRGSDILAGEGVGTCSTMESKYRYRWDNTGQEVPSEYWEHRDKEILGGDSYTARKISGRWLIFRRTEHDNPVDYWNTAKKMGKKRAHIDATITATSASDIFTQDIEDEPKESTVVEAPKTVTPPKRKSAVPKAEDPAPQAPPQNPTDYPVMLPRPEGMLDIHLIKCILLKIDQKEGETVIRSGKKKGQTSKWKRTGIQIVNTKTSDNQWINTMDRDYGEIAKWAFDNGKGLLMNWSEGEFNGNPKYDVVHLEIWEE